MAKSRQVRRREWSKVKRPLSPGSVLARRMLAQPRSLSLYTKFIKGSGLWSAQTRERVKESSRGQLLL